MSSRGLGKGTLKSAPAAKGDGDSGAMEVIDRDSW